MISNKTTFAFIFLILTAQALAGEFKPYAGFNFGYDSLDTDKKSEADKNGYDLGVKLIGSFKFEKFYLDGGLGYQYESLFGKGISQQTSSPFGELALRVRLNDSWSFGPITQLHFAEDNSRSEKSGKNSSMWDLGGQLVYDPNLKKLPVRFETMITKSISGLDDRELYSIKFGIHIPFGANTPEKTVHPVVHYKPKVIESIPVVVFPAVVQKDRYIKEDTDTLRIRINSDMIGFKPNSSDLDERSLQKLKELGEYIVKEKVEMQSMKISGHTDRQGSRAYNLKLSEERAMVVKKALVEAGVETNILTYGYGFSKPIDDRDSADAWEKNRRTEIEFIKVVDKGSLIKEINTIMKN